jgi:hypothetical protein
MDGVAGLSQKNIGPGETFKYEFGSTEHTCITLTRTT